MNYLKSTAAGLVLCISIAACNSSTDTSAPMNGTDSSMMTANSSKSATADSTGAMKDTSMAAIKDSGISKKAASGMDKKKKLKASVGDMAPSVSKKYNKNSMGVYDNAEVMPSYKGGSSAIDDYVNTNLNAPQIAIDDSKEGTIPVAFTVDETGKVTNVHTTGTKLGDGLDEEAIRVVSSMPKWTPGTIQGKPVKVALTLPMVFKAEE